MHFIRIKNKGPIFYLLKSYIKCKINPKLTSMRILLIFIYLHLTTLLVGQNYVWESSRNGVHITDIIRFGNTAAYDIKDFRFNFKPYECSIGIPDSTFQGFTPDFYDSIRFLTLNPNIDYIEAVLYPEETPCLFYLHDTNGQIHCSKTYEEHLENIDKYLN